jgi:hypothetical protein
MTTTDKVQTGTGGNYFFLDSPMQVDGPVFMGLEWSTTMDDTLALYSDADGEGDNANRAWEKFSDESYNDFQTGLNPDFSWAIDVDLWIAVYYKKAVVSSIMDELKSHIASTYVLSQNYPNPFNPTTRFRLQIPKQSDVSVVVYNVLGQRVEELFNGKLPAGSHEFVFEGQRYASGVYFYRVQAGSFTDIKKMILVK